MKKVSLSVIILGIILSVLFFLHQSMQSETAAILENSNNIDTPLNQDKIAESETSQEVASNSKIELAGIYFTLPEKWAIREDIVVSPDFSPRGPSWATEKKPGEVTDNCAEVHIAKTGTAILISKYPEEVNQSIESSEAYANWSIEVNSTGEQNEKIIKIDNVPFAYTLNTIEGCGYSVNLAGRIEGEKVYIAAHYNDVNEIKEVENFISSISLK